MGIVIIILLVVFAWSWSKLAKNLQDDIDRRKRLDEKISNVILLILIGFLGGIGGSLYKDHQSQGNE